MLALAKLTQRCVEVAKERGILHIHLFADNQSAVSTINSPKPHAAQYASLLFRESAHSFLAENPDRSVTVRWIPGHTSIPGNDRADALANESADLDPDPMFHSTATWLKSNATENARSSWHTIWDQAKRSEHTRRLLPNAPSLTLNKIFAKGLHPRKANVFVSNDGSPVLADFGNSLYKDQAMKFTETASVSSLTVRWSASAVVHYGGLYLYFTQAAELLDGSGVHSEASDVYALAMTICEVLAGVLPYEGKLTFAIMNLVVNKRQPPERPQAIAAGREDGDKLWNLLLRCWSFEPKARPSASKVADIIKTVTPGGLSPVNTCELPNLPNIL